MILGEGIARALTWIPAGSRSSSFAAPLDPSAKAAQDEDVPVKGRHGQHDLLQEQLVRLGRGLGERRRLGRQGLAPGAPAFVPHEVHGDPQQERPGVADVADAVGRGAQIGVLHHIGGAIRIDVGPETAIEPDRIAAIEAVQPLRRFRVQPPGVGQHASPSGGRTGILRREGSASTMRRRAQDRTAAGDRRAGRASLCLTSHRGFQAPAGASADAPP